MDERRMRPAGGDGGESPGRAVPPSTDAVVAVARVGDAVCITVTGEVDMANAALVEDRIQQGVTAGAASVTLDLTGLRYIDSAGLWILFRLGARLQAAGVAGELLVPADGPVRRMVETAGVGAALPIRFAAD